MALFSVIDPEFDPGGSLLTPSYHYSHKELLNVHHQANQHILSRVYITYLTEKVYTVSTLKTKTSISKAHCLPPCGVGLKYTFD